MTPSVVVSIVVVGPVVGYGVVGPDVVGRGDVDGSTQLIMSVTGIHYGQHRINQIYWMSLIYNLKIKEQFLSFNTYVFQPENLLTVKASLRYRRNAEKSSKLSGTII